MYSNFIDLGIIPINLNMLKKDVHLFNIALNSSLYKKFLNNMKMVTNTKLVDDLLSAATAKLMKK